MVRLENLIGVAQLLSLSHAVPLLTTRFNEARASRWNADELNKESKGIHWNHVVNEDCTSEQVDKIVWTYASYVLSTIYHDR
jgi:hypothetical protein